MTDQINYPSIDDGYLTPLRVLRLLYKSNPDLFDRPECPYSGDQVVFLRGLIEGGSEPVERESFLAKADDKYEALGEQIALTLEDIRTLEGNLNKLDQRDRVQFLKAKPGLLEKLIELQERTTNMRSLSEFMKRVYTFIDKEMTPDQRTSLMKALGEHI